MQPQVGYGPGGVSGVYRGNNTQEAIQQYLNANQAATPAVNRPAMVVQTAPAATATPAAPFALGGAVRIPTAVSAYVMSPIPGMPSAGPATGPMTATVQPYVARRMPLDGAEAAQPTFAQPVEPLGLVNPQLSARLSQRLQRISGGGGTSYWVEVHGSTAILRGTIPSERDRALADQLLRLEPAISTVIDGTVAQTAGGQARGGATEQAFRSGTTATR